MHKITKNNYKKYLFSVENTELFKIVFVTQPTYIKILQICYSHFDKKIKPQVNSLQRRQKTNCIVAAMLLNIYSRLIS